MKGPCFFLCIIFVILIVYSTAEKEQSHKVVKRQSTSQRAFPLSRRRQFPSPEELEESDEYATSEDEEEPQPRFRGRQPPQPAEEEYSDDYSYTEAPKVTTPAPPKPTSRSVVFNNRFAGRPRFGVGAQSSTSTQKTTASTPSTTTVRFRATPAQSQRLDVVANILNKPPAPRPASRSIASSSSSNQNRQADKVIPEKLNTTTTRVRTRGRFRPRTSTTTTTTTTTTEAPPAEEYYYYYEDEEPKDAPIATTTTTTTTQKPTLPRRPFARRPTGVRTTPKPVKFDPESQFAPPPDDIAPLEQASTSTKKFTTTTTEAPGPGGIPAHLKHKYKVRTDNRFIDFLRDPNRPRELKGFDLTDYPFYVKVPEDITFDCDDMKDGYYASVPHHCQLFHYCFAGARYDFLCANYTLYDQTTFTCRFANNVDCESSEKYYYRNDDLWKETTTTAAPEPKKRKITPKDDDYEEEYDDDEDYEEEEEVERRRRPAKRRRNRRKNRRKPAEE